MFWKTEGTEKLPKEIPHPESLPADIPLSNSIQNKLQDFFSSPGEQIKETITLDDGTIITSPSTRASVHMQHETNNRVDLFTAFGINENVFSVEVPTTPSIIGSSNLDFWSAFDEYTNEELYMHDSNEKCESTRMTGPNCLAYAYGISKEIDGDSYHEKPCPGHFSGLNNSASLEKVMATGSPALIKRVLEHYIKSDSEALGKELKEVKSNEYQPQHGERMFALVTAPNFMGYSSDFHFYVKDRNGYWSHKPGTTNPTIFDNSGSTIKNPETCNRGAYTNFVGYYVMKDKEVST